MNFKAFISGLAGRKDEAPTPGYYDILSLSGGGLMGLYSARILDHMEQATGRPAAQSFSLVAGTSIGGMLAIGLSREIPAADMVETFMKNANEIFMPRADTHLVTKRMPLKIGKLAVSMMRSYFEAEALSKTVKDIIGEDTKLGQAKHPLLVTAYDLTTGSNRTFTAPVAAANGFDDLDIKMHDIAMATSAIPAMFPIHEFGGHKFVDGAVFANCPDLVAVKQATYRQGIPFDKIRMCSIGTMTGRFTLPASTRNDIGILSWSDDNRLATLMMAGQQQFAVAFMREVMAANYLRIDTQAADGSEPSFTPGNITRDDLDKIVKAADTSWAYFKNDPLLKAFLKT